jgi:hypothetical protein
MEQENKKLWHGLNKPYNDNKEKKDNEEIAEINLNEIPFPDDEI